MPIVYQKTTPGSDTFNTVSGREYIAIVIGGGGAGGPGYGDSGGSDGGGGGSGGGTVVCKFTGDGSALNVVVGDRGNRMFIINIADGARTAIAMPTDCNGAGATPWSAGKRADDGGDSSITLGTMIATAEGGPGGLGISNHTSVQTGGGGSVVNITNANHKIFNGSGGGVSNAQGDPSDATPGGALSYEKTGTAGLGGTPKNSLNDTAGGGGGIAGFDITWTGLELSDVSTIELGTGGKGGNGQDNQGACYHSTSMWGGGASSTKPGAGGGGTGANGWYTGWYPGGHGGYGAVYILVDNTAPVANFSLSNAVDGRLDVTDSSTDADGSITQWVYNFGGSGKLNGAGSTITSKTYTSAPGAFNFVYDAPGTKTVTLTVTDDGGFTDTASNTKTVYTTPTADIVNASGVVYAGQAIMALQGGGSSDPFYTSAQLSYQWSIDNQPVGSNVLANSYPRNSSDQPIYTSDNLEITPMIAGNYTIRLQVTNPLSRSNSTTITVSVPDFSSTPTAFAGADRSVLINKSMTLNGGGSSDVDGDALTYNWSLISGPAGGAPAFDNTTSVTPAVSFNVAGVYNIRLTVSDPDGNVSTDDVTITVTPGEQVINFIDSGTLSMGETAETVRDAARENAYVGRSVAKFAYQCGQGTNAPAIIKMGDVGDIISTNLITAQQIAKPYRMSDSYSMLCCRPAESFELVSAGIKQFQMRLAVDNDYSVDSFELEVSLNSSFTNIIHSEVIPGPTASDGNSVFWKANNACPETEYFLRCRTKKQFTTPRNHVCYSGWTESSISTLTLKDGIDLVFLIDNTGSMGSSIAAVNSATASVVNTLNGITNDWRIAGYSYNDPGAQKQFDWRTDPTQIASGFNFGAYGGGDAPEATYYGIGLALGQSWRPDVARIIIIITDITSKATNGWTESRAINACLDRGVVLVGIHTQPSWGGVGQLQTLTDATGGVTLLSSSSSLGSDLNALFTDHLVPNCAFDSNGNKLGYIEGKSGLV